MFAKYHTFALVCKKTIVYTRHSNIIHALGNGTITCRGLVDHYLKTIDEHQHLNAFVEVYADEARAKAEELDKKSPRLTSMSLSRCTVTAKSLWV